MQVCAGRTAFARVASERISTARLNPLCEHGAILFLPSLDSFAWVAPVPLTRRYYPMTR